MQFDIIIGNPPYQDTTGAAMSKPIWHKFVEKAFDLCKQDGYVSLVHPGSWRGGGSKAFSAVKKLLTENNTLYINMNSKAQGEKTFGASTSYDYYASQKAKYNGETALVGFKDERKQADLRKLTYIPCGDFAYADKVIAKSLKDITPFIHNSSYHSQRDHVQESQTDEYKYPVLYRLLKGKERLMYTNDNTKGHFGVSKVVLCTGGSSTDGNVFIDKDGTYGLSQFCYAIPCEPDECQDVYDFLKSEATRAFFAANKTGIDFYDRKMLTNFVKDFWK